MYYSRVEAPVKLVMKLTKLVDIEVGICSEGGAESKVIKVR